VDHLVKSIRQLREEQDWTQLELAVKLGVTPATVYNWERGRYEPSATKLRQIARLFGISMDDVELVEEGKIAA
jgi:transcriptional regulator with XRE-family HTH domain